MSNKPVIIAKIFLLRLSLANCLRFSKIRDRFSFESFNDLADNLHEVEIMELDKIKQLEAASQEGSKK